MTYSSDNHSDSHIHRPVDTHTNSHTERNSPNKAINNSPNQTTLHIATPLKSANLNHSNMLIPLSFGGIIMVLASGMLLLAHYNDEGATAIYAGLAMMVFLASVIMKLMVPKMWHLRKVGRVQMSLDSFDKGEQALSGQLHITPQSRVVIDEISLAWMTIEKSVMVKDDKVGSYTFTKIIDPQPIRDTLVLAKERAVSLPFTIILPKDASPTFDKEGNKLTWALQVQILSGDFALLEQQNFEMTTA